jgi:hypothetical protein
MNIEPHNPQFPASRLADGAGDATGTPVQRALHLHIDKNGSPVTVSPAEWLVCFVPGLQRQWWHRFVPGFQHVFLIRPINHDQWLLFEPWWSRLMVSTLNTEEALRFLKWADAGAVLRVRERIPGAGSQLRGWSNCAVLAAFLLGRRYYVLSPNTLFRRLAAEPGVEQVRVPELLSHYFANIVSSIADSALAPAEALLSHSSVAPREQLMFLASRIISALNSPSLAMAYRVADAESSTYPSLATTLRDRGTERALQCARTALEQMAKGLDTPALDPDSAADAFVESVRSWCRSSAHAGARHAQKSGNADHREMVDTFLGQLRSAA